MSEYLFEHLRQAPHPLSPPRLQDGDYLRDDDLHLGLYACYELHYRGFEEVPDSWEWEPSLLALRAGLEAGFVSALRQEVGAASIESDDVTAALQQILVDAGGPSLSAYLETDGTIDEFREYAIHRSAYQLKEADPHTWAIPRLSGGAKAALVLIQIGEYGDGRVEAMHTERFAVTMRALDLEPGYGAYLDHIPGLTLATVNLMSMFGLHRRWLGALVGQLALFEMSSVEPMGRYARGLHRLGLASPAAGFYEVHVEADEYHQLVALQDLAAGFARQEPTQVPNMLFGARAALALEGYFAEHLLASWRERQTSLRRRAADGAPMSAVAAHA